MVSGSGISTSCRAEVAEAESKAAPFKRAFAVKRIGEMCNASLIREVEMALVGGYVGADWYASALKNEALKRKLSFGAR